MKKPKKPPDEIRLLVEQWVGAQESIRHWWEQENTYFIVAFAVEALFFLRVFSVADSFRLSCDREINFADLDKQ